MTFNGRFLLNLIEFAATQGALANELIVLSGFSKDVLCDESTKVTSEVYNTVVEKAVFLTKDEYFGLHAGEYLNLSAAGLVGQISQTSATVKQALDFCCEFASLGCRALPMKLEEDHADFKLAFEPDPIWKQESEISTKHTIDGALAFILREFHTLTLQKYYPLKIHFQFKKPANTREYERLFNCPLMYAQTETAIFFSRKHVMEPVVTSSFDLLRVLVKHAYEKLAEIEKENGFYQTVKKAVVNLVKPEFPTIEQVAANLNVSVRTLQRKLSDEGYTFKEIIEMLRKDFALSYIKNRDLSVGEIAYLLSYSDSSTFIRSFKRWTGKTPQAYRTIN
ncbi:AraC family transcriptional regulator [Chondrinema litorale]|uniref:AraC family transcriptional regulator n=1 Tax=Chondrinema litorale TaxID=2994555 RepID=UPI002543186F|nr:AraC family transcriptional regulator [Chondrinema litorale]UZR97047.1 AraC family transcriptional regulator ligand-binding domain-containing protein [Chondrinema litorale]